MALHLKADFAKMCGLTTGNLTVYIGRKKVIPSGDYIDDTLQVNKDFLEKRKILLTSKNSTASEDPQPKKLRMIKPDPGNPDPPNVQDPEEDDLGDDDDEVSGESLTLLSKKKVKAEIVYKRLQSEQAKLRIEKQRGILIPTDLVKVVFKQHSQSILVEFKNSIDNVLTIFRKKKDLNANEVAEIRGELAKALNQAVDKSINQSKKSIRNIVNEYTETKEVGERS